MPWAGTIALLRICLPSPATHRAPVGARHTVPQDQTIPFVVLKGFLPIFQIKSYPRGRAGFPTRLRCVARSTGQSI